MRITVFRRIPPPIIGTCGIVIDRDFDAFEECLDALEATGVTVERLDPDDAQHAIATRPAVQRVLATHGERCWPVTLVNDDVVAWGRYPSRREWAHALGTVRRHEQAAVTT
jgi:hypothetical protein